MSNNQLLMRRVQNEQNFNNINKKDQHIVFMTDVAKIVKVKGYPSDDYSLNYFN